MTPESSSTPKHKPVLPKLLRECKLAYGKLFNENVALTGRCEGLEKRCDALEAELEIRLIEESAKQSDLIAALRDLHEACTDAYKIGRIPAEPFVRAGNVLAKAVQS